MSDEGLTLQAGLRLISIIANRLAPGNDGRELDGYLRTPRSLDDRDLLGMIAQAEYRWRRQREGYLPADLFGEPAWDILLDLYVSEVECRRVSVTSSCIASSVPPTTAIRYLSTLEARGLIERRRDDLDHRRNWLSLTSKGRAMIERYLRAQIRSYDRPAQWMMLGKLFDGDDATLPDNALQSG